MLLAFLRLRTDRAVAANECFGRVTKRMALIWCQALETSLQQHLLTTCPDCTVSAKYHPFQRSSRAKGNKSLSLSLVGRFQARPSGYVSLKNETTLKELGLVSKQSKLGSKTSFEYTVRLLNKTATFVNDHVAAGLRVLNVCMDAAMVAEESVA